MLTLEQAVAKVSRQAGADQEPVIEPSEVRAIVEECGIALHAVSTAYAFGDRVLPATGNGRVYRCVVPGTSGATAPVWSGMTCGYYGYRFSDGTATWEDAGPAPAEQYDVNLATYKVLLRKKAESPDDMDFSSSDEKVSLSQRQKNLDALLKRYEPVFMA